MNQVIHWFLETTAVGSFWTPVLRVGLLTMLVNEAVIVMLVLFDRKRSRAWSISFRRRLGLMQSTTKPGD